MTDAHRVRCEPIDTFDRGSTWTLVSGVLDRDCIDTAAHWDDAVAAGRRALATELVATAEAILELATAHLATRTQFGHPIGSFQAPRHALAGAFAELEGARALTSEAWRDGGDFAAVVAKSAAGQAHRAVGEAAMQVCGAIGMTAEHDLHRHVARGVQIDALLGSHLQLEPAIADHLLDADEPDGALPTVVACG
ncbi:MAG: acyl-CoA dehydrogenase family protein [Mycobacterium sp.]|nr:acyl-CoA dehydrogenase family protein [Mycobacterium sp.]